MNTIGQTKDQLGIGVSAGSLTPAILAGDRTQIPTNRLYFIMVTDGESMVEVDRHDYTVQKGAFIYVLPHHLLTLRSCSDDFKTVYACFTFDILSDFPLLLKAELSDYVGNHPCLDLGDKDYAALSKYYDLLIDRYRSEDVGMEIIKGLLFSLVMEVNRYIPGGMTQCKSPIRASSPTDSSSCFISISAKNIRLPFTPENCACPTNT